MSFLDPRSIPGYREAVEMEEANRDLALFDTVPICGLSCKPMSVRSWVLLRQMGDRFVTGSSMPTPEDIAVFLWIHSPEYRLDEKFRIKWVKRHIRPLFKSHGVGWCIDQINRHIERSFQDSMGGGGGGKSYINSAAGVVDLIASQYGWTDQHILDMPLARIFLFQRAIIMRHNPKKPMSNGSDRVLSDYMVQRQAEFDIRNRN